MALLGNYSVLNKNPGRSFGGSTVSDNRSEYGKSGALRGRYCQTGGFSALTSVPSGYRPPYSWQIAIESGALSSTNLIVGEGALSGAGARGVNAAATLPGDGSLSAVGQLVVSAVATLAGSGDIPSANLLAVLNAAATLAGSSDIPAADLLAKGWMAATAPGEGSVVSTLTATAECVAAIQPFSDLSPESLSSAVWSTDEARLLYALAHNRVVTDPATGTFTVYDVDDSTVLYQADLWADADGTTPYAGSGAERRDRLV